MAGQRLRRRNTRVGAFLTGLGVAGTVLVVASGSPAGAADGPIAAEKPDVREALKDPERFLTPDERRALIAHRKAARPAIYAAPRVAKATRLEDTTTPQQHRVRAYMAREMTGKLRARLSLLPAADRAALDVESAVAQESDFDYWVLPADSPDTTIVSVFPAGTDVQPDGSVTADSDFDDAGAVWHGSWGQPDLEDGFMYVTNDGGYACGRTDGRLDMYWDGRRMIENYYSDYVGVQFYAYANVFEDTGSAHCYDYIDYHYGKMWSSQPNVYWADFEPKFTQTRECTNVPMGLAFGPASIGINPQWCDEWQVPRISTSAVANGANSYFVKYVSDSGPFWGDDDNRAVEGMGLLRTGPGQDSGRNYRFYMQIENDVCGSTVGLLCQTWRD